MHKDDSQFNISTWTMFRFFGIIIGLVILYVVRDVVVALVLAIIIASAIEPGIEWLKEKKIPRILGVIMIYLSFFLFLFLLVYLILPLVLDDLRTIFSTYPELQKQVLAGVDRASALPLFPTLHDTIEGLLQVPANYIDKLGGGVVNTVSSIFGGLLSFILIVVFSFYLATQEDGIENFLRLLTPLSYEPYIVDLWKRSQRKLGRWLRAQMLLGAVVGVLIFFGLTFLGVEHALSFAFISGVFELIPVVGPILGAVPAVATAFLTSPIVGVFTVLLYVVVQQTESHVIVPVVMRKTIGLSPLVVVFALVAGAKIGGIMGVVLAVPITAIAAEFLNDWDKKKRSLLPE